MKLKGLILSAALLTGASSLSAASLTWDSNGASPGAPLNGTGIWDTSSAKWSDGSTDGVWNNVNNDTAVFGGGASTGTAGTVALGSSITTGGLVFNLSGYTLTGDTLTLSGATPAITVNTGTATLASAVAGTGGVTKSGTGTLVLSGANSFTGAVTIDAGTLLVGGSNALTTNNDVIFAAGSSNAVLSIQASSNIKSLTVGANATGATITTNQWSPVNYGTTTLNGSLTLKGTGAAGWNGMTFKGKLTGSGVTAGTDALILDANGYNAGGAGFVWEYDATNSGIATANDFTGNVRVKNGVVINR